MGYKRYDIALGEFVAFVFLLIHLIIGILFSDTLPIIMDWYGISFLVGSIFIWRKRTGDNYFSLFSILMLFFVLFNYGIPSLWALGIHFKDEFGTKPLIYGFNFVPTSNDIMKAQIYTCVSMFVFLIGIIVIQNRNYTSSTKCDRSIESSNDAEGALRSLKFVSTIMLCIFAPIAIIISVYTYTIARRYGYAALYYGQHQVQTGYSQILMYFFYPSLFGYIIGNQYSKKSRIIAYSIFGIYSLLNILSGDRGSWLYSLIILIWLHTYYTKASIKTYLKYFAFGLIGLYLLSAITSVRDVGLDSLNMELFLSALSPENNPIVSAMKEMGGSMGIIMYLLHTGNKIFPYANTYLTSILGVISSRVLALFGLKQILLADWFSQDYLGLPWGMGFSMIGEAYINGGYLGGFIYIFLIGIAHGCILKTTKQTNYKDPLQLFINVVGLNVIIGFARGALYLTLKELFYGVFIYVLMVKLVYKYVFYKNERQI